MKRWMGVLLALSLSTVGASGADQTVLPGMFPFVMPLERVPGCQIDASGWLDAPAGREGFVHVANGHFATLSGRIRFWGTNVAFGGCFPDKATAPLVADKLARFGTNIVRIHSADIIDGRPSLIDRSTTDTQHLNAENLDRMDFFVAELKKRGIYTNINLHVNRTFTVADGVSDAAALPTFAKNITLFDPRMIELQRKFATDVLTHVNPYTGNAYASEPALAFVEITNENSFFYGWYSGKLDNLPPSYASQLDARFLDWLRRKYATTDALRAAWGDALPPNESIEGGRVSRPKYKEAGRNDACLRDYLACLWEIEHEYFRAMRDHLKDTVGVRMPVTGTMYFTMAGGMIQADLMDFVDMHAYWQHPEFKAEWKGKWTIENTPMVDQPTSNTLTWLGASRVADKPFAVSEFNAPWPNFHDAEGLPLAAAYAARQDWDAVYVFNFNGNGEFRRDKVHSFFDIDAHPVKTIQMIAGAAMFARGDVDAAQDSQIATVSRGAAIDSAVRFGWNHGEAALAEFGWRDVNTVDRRFALHFLHERLDIVATMDAAKIPVSQASPVEWSKGRAIVDAPRSRLLVGRPDGAAVKLGSVSVRLLPSAGNFATISLHSMDNSPNAIERSRNVLLIAAGRTLNTGMEWDADNRSAYKNMGRAPVLTEGVPATIGLADAPAGATRVYALDEAGAIRGELTARSDSTGLAFDIGSEHRTMWYLIRQGDK